MGGTQQKRKEEMAIITSQEATSYTPGTLGIGVGNLVAGIVSRGEDEVVFQSVVWFPYDEAEEARRFADECEMYVREGIAL